MSRPLTIPEHFFLIEMRQHAPAARLLVYYTLDACRRFHREQRELRERRAAR